MARRQRLTPSERRAEAEMAERHKEKMDKQGLCRFCSERPQNPFLDSRTCLDCYKNHPNSCCINEGCYEDVAARYEQRPFCEVHLADVLHKEYKRYLTLMDELVDMREKLGFLMVKRVYDTNERPEEVDDIGEQHEDIRSLKNQIRMTQRELDILKSNIKEANKKAGGVFPENYEVF